MRSDTDEKYVIDLISEILKENYKHQKRFDTLLGDPGRQGRRIKLPVDAFFYDSNLIVEYREIQHFKSVPIMDRHMTISGISRGEQRKRYDLRKEKWAVDNDIYFLVVAYNDLDYKKNGKLTRNYNSDRIIIKRMIERLVRR